MKENKKKEIRKKLVWILLYLFIGLCCGIWIGMQIQQMIIIAGLIEFGESLEGTNIEINVDLNETMLIEGFKESIIPIFNQSINEAELK